MCHGIDYSVVNGFSVILTNANVVENDQIVSLNFELLMAGKYWLVLMERC